MAQRQSIPVQTLTPAVDAPYSSKIIKAGALLPDTKTLLSQWDRSATVQANLARIRQENVFGKASRSRVEDILAIFRQRYLTDPGSSGPSSSSSRPTARGDAPTASSTSTRRSQTGCFMTS